MSDSVGIGTHTIKSKILDLLLDQYSSSLPHTIYALLTAKLGYCTHQNDLIYLYCIYGYKSNMMVKNEARMNCLVILITVQSRHLKAPSIDGSPVVIFICCPELKKLPNLVTLVMNRLHQSQWTFQWMFPYLPSPGLCVVSFEFDLYLFKSSSQFFDTFPGSERGIEIENDRTNKRNTLWNVFIQKRAKLKI